MKPLRGLGRLLLAVLLGGAMFAVCYSLASFARVAMAGRPADDLAWLGREFRLTEAELARIRPLHEGYRPRCVAMCARIAAKDRELTAALDSSTNVTAEVERLLGEAAALRAQCQAQMLRHFQQVAQAMPAGQGTRYLAEMRRLTLGGHRMTEDMMPAHEHP